MTPNTIIYNTGLTQFVIFIPSHQLQRTQEILTSPNLFPYTSITIFQKKCLRPSPYFLDITFLRIVFLGVMYVIEET